GFNNGVYPAGATTSNGTATSDAKYAVEFGAGIAYIKGYRVKRLSPSYVDLDKPRETLDAQNVIVPFEMGNFSNVTNIFGFPNTSGSTITNAYHTLELRDTASSSAGSAAGDLIGYARVTSIEHLNDPDNTFGNADDQYKLNVMDVQMFTVLELASAKSIAQGSLVIGGTSGARAYIVSATTSSDRVDVYQVEGTFLQNEMLLVDGAFLDTIKHIHSYQYSDTRQFVARDESTSAIEFTADLV
ncbi:hypothetical protein, partial [Thermus thermophilus]|uniref:hypothetical protein n=1 Tax=Thermus thermophilus TaxID=274 RepID=UPI001A9C53BB|nr:hypothetical protein [Thermus thermophilus]